MFLQTERVTKKDLLQISPKLIQNKFALLNVKVLCTVCNVCIMSTTFVKVFVALIN